MRIFERFGLRQVVNGCGKMTMLGASAVEPEVAEAMAKAAMDYVEFDRLLLAAGTRIAKAAGAEDGCPTAGAAAGIAISAAAVIAGCDPARVESLPNSEGLNNEIILQKGHAVHFGADLRQMIRLGGGKVVEVGCANLVSAAQIEAAISEKTAALFCVKSHHAVQKGMQPVEAMRRIASRHRLPLIVDAAAEEDLKKYTALGADLVIYSGGKAIGGPTSGFVCGRADLCAACRMQYKGIGRAMKVGKESVIGLLAALERYAARREEATEQKERMQAMLAQLTGVEGCRGAIVQDEAGRDIYRAELTIDARQAGVSAEEVAAALMGGAPAIYTRNYELTRGKIQIDPRPLLAGQENIIAARLKEIMREAKRKEE